MIDDIIKNIDEGIEKKISEATDDSYTEEENKILLENHPDYIQAQINKVNLINERIKEETGRLTDDRRARKWYGRGIFGFVALYISAVLAVVIWNHHLTDKVQIALLGSANINVIGLLIAVVRYLFPNHRK